MSGMNDKIHNSTFWVKSYQQDINISFSIELGKMCILIQVERKNIEKLFKYEFLKS